MALDTKEVLKKSYEIERDLNELISVLRVYKDGKANIPHVGDVKFSPAQNAVLKNRFAALKTSIQTKLESLPT